jgi:hypothetical protein
LYGVLISTVITVVVFFVIFVPVCIVATIAATGPGIYGIFHNVMQFQGFGTPAP